MEYMDCTNNRLESQDEVEKYQAMSINSAAIDPSSFVNDSFAVVRFWYNRRGQFPKLYRVAMKVLATPVSSSSSERVFSTLKKLVTSDRVRLSGQNVENILVARSLLNK